MNSERDAVQHMTAALLNDKRFLLVKSLTRLLAPYEMTCKLLNERPQHAYVSFINALIAELECGDGPVPAHTLAACEKILTGNKPDFDSTRDKF